MKNTLFSLVMISALILFQSCIQDMPPLTDPFLGNSSPTTIAPGAQYNDVFQKACHNCYENLCPRE